MTRETRQPARLAIHVRTVYVGDGGEHQQRFGYCPFCERSLPVEMVGDRPLEPAHDGVPRDASRSPSIMSGRVSLRPAETAALATAAARTSIATVMSHDFVCVRPELSVETAEALFLARGVGGAPVIDESGRLVGFVATSDLLRARCEAGDDREAGAPLGAGFHEVRLTRATIEEIMMPIAFALPECAPLAKAAALMAFEGVHRIPVISHRGEVVGILSALDVMRWTAQQDGYLVPPYTQRERLGSHCSARD